MGGGTYSYQIPGAMNENGGRNSAVSAVSNSAIQVEQYVPQNYVASINYSNYQQQHDQQYERIQRSFNSAQHIPKPSMQQCYEPSINNQCTTNYENPNWSPNTLVFGNNPENPASDWPYNIFANDYSPVQAQCGIYSPSTSSAVYSYGEEIAAETGIAMPFADQIGAQMTNFAQNKAETVTNHQTNAANAVVQEVPIAPTPSTSVTRPPKRAASQKRRRNADSDRASDSGRSTDECSASPKKVKYVLVDEVEEERRTLANERERERTTIMNKGYDGLRKLIPLDRNEKLSKLETLQRAAKYITFLTDIIRCPTEESDTLQGNLSGIAIDREVFVDMRTNVRTNVQNEKLLQAFKLWEINHNRNR